MSGTRYSAAQRLSVLLVHGSAELYGSDRACLTVASAAASAGFDTHVIVPADGPLRPLLERAGATVHVLDPWVLRRADLRGVRVFRTVMRWPATVLRLRRFSRRYRFALVHSNCAPTLGGALLARWWDVPHVWQVHEVVKNERASRMLFERLLLQADVILAASNAIRDQFRSPQLRKRCRIAYTGGEVSEDIVGVSPLGRSHVELICVGRLSDRKGQEFLIKAVHLLRNRGIDVRLKLVGEVFGTEYHFRERIEDLIAKLGLEPFVTLLGERRDALQFMAEADIVVVPSVQPEAFGIVVVEAMALGRAIIASDEGGPREIITVGHDGLLVRPGNVADLGDAINRLIDDPAEARRLGANARVTAKRFSPAALAEQALETYRDLLAQMNDLPRI